MLFAVKLLHFVSTFFLVKLVKSVGHLYFHFMTFSSMFHFFHSFLLANLSFFRSLIFMLITISFTWKMFSSIEVSIHSKKSFGTITKFIRLYRYRCICMEHFLLLFEEIIRIASYIVYHHIVSF